MIIESQKVSQAAADVYFVDAPLSYQKKLIMIIARSQIPIEFTAGKFVSLSLNTLVKVSYNLMEITYINYHYCIVKWGDL